MAGPGGGPPRRSHTKSRKGCEMCKRRHIRCDEQFPQCNNCIKHKIRCPYNDLPMPMARPSARELPAADLMWTAENDAAITKWQLTGYFPFPMVNLYPNLLTKRFSRDELRLIYHMGSTYSQIHGLHASGFTLWTAFVPEILRLAVSYEYVMHSVLAFAATHIAFLTECPRVTQMAENYRFKACGGLREALDNWSQKSSDAILAASIVMSWQSPDWYVSIFLLEGTWPSNVFIPVVFADVYRVLMGREHWMQTMSGIKIVVNTMRQWQHKSHFLDIISADGIVPPGPLPHANHSPQQPSIDDITEYEGTLIQLEKVEKFLHETNQDQKPISQLIDFTRNVGKLTSLKTCGQQFEKLRPLRAWMFWLPVKYIQSTEASPTSLLIISQYYMVVMMLSRLLPEFGEAHFGSLVIRPTENIIQKLRTLVHLQDGEKMLELVEFPGAMAASLQLRNGCEMPPKPDPGLQSLSQPLPLPFTAPRLDSHPVMRVSHPRAPPPITAIAYSGPQFNYSPPLLDDFNTSPPLAVTTEEVPKTLDLAKPGIIAPHMPLSQYLTVPPSCFAPGLYSPASSTFGERMLFDDKPDFALPCNDSMNASLLSPPPGIFGCTPGQDPLENFSVGSPYTPTTPVTPFTTAMPTSTFGLPGLQPAFAAPEVLSFPLPESPAVCFGDMHMDPNQGQFPPYYYYVKPKAENIDNNDKMPYQQFLQTPFSGSACPSPNFPHHFNYLSRGLQQDL